jgi:hypothetical protein
MHVMKRCTRGALILCLAGVASLFLLDGALAQNPNPGTITGRPPVGPIGPIGPRPGGITGGAPMPGGMPGTFSGAAGGITGSRPGGMGGSLFVKIWKCPRCQRELGRGEFPPASVTCCGQTYVNGRSLGFSPFSGPASSSSSSAPGFFGGGSAGGPGAGTSRFNARFILIGGGIVVFGLLILGGVVVLVIQSQRPSRPKRRRVRVDY